MKKQNFNKCLDEIISFEDLETLFAKHKNTMSSKIKKIYKQEIKKREKELEKLAWAIVKDPLMHVAMIFLSRPITDKKLKQKRNKALTEYRPTFSKSPDNKYIWEDSQFVATQALLGMFFIINYADNRKMKKIIDNFCN